MKNSSFLISLLILAAIPFMAHSQTEDGGKQTIREQFQDMLESSESYTEYKVIKRTKLSEFSRSVQDSLATNRSQISGLNSEVAELKSQVSQLTTRIADLEEQLEKSEKLRESLLFMGIQMNKATYHLFVWIVIAALVVFGIFAYTSFMRSNKITSKTKKEMSALEVEYDEHKKKSHEKQIKMGRELQTERNYVEELKTKLKAKSSTK
jgi:capsule polysaccharide export protein KpsE/RkpR